MTTHILKIRGEYFDAVKRGEKTCEVHFNDRDFDVGDILVLRLVEPDGNGAYTIERPDHEWYVVVTHVLEGGQFGIEPGYVVLSIRSVRII